MLETPIKTTSLVDRPSRLPRASHILPDPFVFVPISTAEAAKGRGSAKRIVRAHVTRVQHAKSSTLSSIQHLQDWTVQPQTHRPPLSTKQRPKLPTPGSSSASSSDDKAQIVSSETAVITIPGIPASKRNGSGRQDPFWTYPVDYEPYLPAIFAHCRWHRGRFERH